MEINKITPKGKKMKETPYFYQHSKYLANTIRWTMKNAINYIKDGEYSLGASTLMESIKALYNLARYIDLTQQRLTESEETTNAENTIKDIKESLYNIFFSDFRPQEQIEIDSHYIIKITTLKTNKALYLMESGQLSSEIDNAKQYYTEKDAKDDIDCAFIQSENSELLDWDEEKQDYQYKLEIIQVKY